MKVQILNTNYSTNVINNQKNKLSISLTSKPNFQDEKIIQKTRDIVSELCSAFPIYEESAINAMPQL